jgi:Mn-dependent DtxR family transcriptional regulator
MNAPFTEVWNQLDGLDLHLFDWLKFLARERGYCQPSRAYLAKQLGVSIWTVSRRVSKLARLGLIYVTHRSRRLANGTIQGRTNLYRIGKWAGNKVEHLLRAILTGVSRRAPRPQKKEEERISLEKIERIGNVEGKSLLKKWLTRGRE